MTLLKNAVRRRHRPDRTSRSSWNATRDRARVLLQRFDERTSEDALAAYFSKGVDFWTARAGVQKPTGRTKAPAIGFLVRHPLRTSMAVVAIARLPRLELRLGKSPDAPSIRAALAPRYLGVLPIGTAGLAVLVVPAGEGAYRQGSSRQTLRRKVRAAESRGVTCRFVEGLQERHDLLAMAEARERAHHDPQYRTAEPDNSDVLQHGLWLVAESAGEPLLLSVTPVSGEWATLRYFRTLGSGPAHSDARYYAMACLVDHLSSLGVRFFLDTTHPLKLTNGLRHFQRMVGFRYARVLRGRAAQSVSRSSAVARSAG